MQAFDDSNFSPPAPIAKIRVSHPDRAEESIEDVPMLIDSGADATLLPRSVIETLRLFGTGKTYQLEGFDGTISESEMVYAVLTFLNKKFRGQYLVVDTEIGVLGRNVLNNLRLLYDGPHLCWQEWKSFASNN